MTVELKTFVLADYAVVERKPTLVGLFDTIFLQQPHPPITMAPLPPHFLFAHCTCASMDGFTHAVVLRLLDADAGETFRYESNITFGAMHGPNAGLTAYITVAIVNHIVPGYGEYQWELAMDGQRLGVTSLGIYPIARGVLIT